jgi:hypothetical protein
MRPSAEVVASSERSTHKLLMFAKTTIKKTPAIANDANVGEKSAATVPRSDVNANVRAPRSLWDHSLSIPTSSPIPSDTAIFAATSEGGK